MSATAVVLSLAIGAPAQAVRLADVDGDGAEELVVQAAGALEVWGWQGAAFTRRSRTPLPDRPGWWDAGHGLWWVDGEGVADLASGRRIAAVATGLPLRGDAAPQQAHMVVDLDQDGTIELLVPTPGGVVVVSPDGRPPVALQGAATVRLTDTARRGGRVRAAAVVPPAVALADWDGDGADDVLLIGERSLTVHPWPPGTPAVTLPLPAALCPPPPGPSTDPSEVTAARWVDLTGDGRADLLLHRLRSDGRLAGTEAELWLHDNAGDHLGPPRVVPTGAGSTEAFPIDLDQDGHLDVLLPQLSLDAGNLAQAVLRRTVEVQVTRVPGGPDGLGAATRMGTLSMPVEDRVTAWTFFDDLSGDGLPDLAVAVDGALRIYPSDGRRLAARASLSLDLGLAAAHLWAADLTGDGAAELVGWAPGLDRVVVARLR